MSESNFPSENFDAFLPGDEPSIEEGKVKEIEPIPQEHINADVSTQDSSLELWNAMVAYYNMGMSMMWGYAKDTIIKGKLKKAKSPLVTTWSSEPEFRLSLDALAKTMAANPNIKLAPIIICGKGSGNLWAIDIDIKHWPGIDTKFLSALRETYPDLYKKLLINQTPSDGFHIMYHTEEFVPGGNVKLAYKEDHKEAGIETRANGGYVMAPPGMGYRHYQNVEPPTISVADHHRIIDMARLYNERKKAVIVPNQKKYESSYDINPFKHFNSSPQAEQVLTNNGWVIDSENTQWVHFTRPGKDHGVSASYNKEKRFYHIFTTSTEFDGDKTYDPAAVLSILQFNNDNKKLFAYLSGQGFGKHNPAYEAKFIKKIVQTGRPLPKNFSEEAQEQLKIATEDRNERYPHGIFWEYNIANDSYGIQRQLLAQFMVTIGMRIHKGGACVIEGQFIRKLREDKKENGAREAFNILHSWIREEEQDTYLRITHTFSQFWQNSGEFMITLLPELDKNLILKSDAKVTYKPFKNGILTITKAGKELNAYPDILPKLIWKDQLIDWDFRYVVPEEQDKTMYRDFVRKAIEGDELYKMRSLGWMCCEYKGESDSYLMALQEPMDASLGGGTGKGVLMKMLRFWTTVLITNGESLGRDVDQWIQSWNDEHLNFIDDVPKGAGLSKFKHITTDDSQRKVLYKNISNISAADMPKFIISGQWGLDTETDGGVKRRVRQLAFSGYFNKDRSVSDEYGGEWPGVWKDLDWDGFYSFIADCVMEYKKVGRLELVENSGLWLKGWDARFSGGENWFRKAIEDKYWDWGRVEYVTRNQIGEWYEKISEGVKPWDKIGMQRVHNAIKEYGEKMDLYSYEVMDGKKKVQVDGEWERVVKVKINKSPDGWDRIQGNDGDEEILPF